MLVLKSTPGRSPMPNPQPKPEPHTPANPGDVPEPGPADPPPPHEPEPDHQIIQDPPVFPERDVESPSHRRLAPLLFGGRVFAIPQKRLAEGHE
jgi:hypothetical protein